MSWWGKLIGGTFGFMLGGPLGAMLGAAVGHNFDRGVQITAEASPFGAGPNQERIQSAFFAATFSVMGHVAKADGRVSEDEIAIARSVMAQMSLNPAQTKIAMDLFNQGKESSFDLDAVMKQFKAECHRRTTLLQMFLEILLHAAYADGVFHPDEAAMIQKISRELGFSDAHYQQLEAMVRAQRFFTGDAGQDRPPPAELLSNAYAVLGVQPTDDDAMVKKAYRRLMSQHHPDKLIAKGLPEEMLKLATEKTQEIRAAYDLVVEHRAK
ncbi:MAG: DnaJ like chaperone protein [Gammaproteobacteria bacterium]|jgi:DnaJ like chaperone protein